MVAAKQGRSAPCELEQQELQRLMPWQQRSPEMWLYPNAWSHVKNRLSCVWILLNDLQQSTEGPANAAEKNRFSAPTYEF